MADVQANFGVTVLLGGSGKEPVTWQAGLSEPKYGGVTYNGGSGKDPKISVWVPFGQGGKVETQFGGDGITPNSSSFYYNGGLLKIEKAGSGDMQYTGNYKDKNGVEAELKLTPGGDGSFSFNIPHDDGSTSGGKITKTEDGIGFGVTYSGVDKDGSRFNFEMGNYGSGFGYTGQTSEGQNGAVKTEFGSIGYSFNNGMLNIHGEYSGDGGKAESASQGFSIPDSDFFKIPEKDIGKWKEGFGEAETATSPLVLDLDGDGVETLSISSGVYFDHDKNGFSESTGWVGKDDGLLVLDRDNDGKIDSGSELFGNNTSVLTGQKAANGFLALAGFDDNKDGVFDSQDTAFSQVSVWVDGNSSGTVDAGELLALDQAKISSISLSYSDPGKLDANGNVHRSVVDSNGNEHRQVGTYTRVDGTAAAIEDIWFDIDGSDTIDKSEIDLSPEISSLPNIEGFGNVHDLRQAMARDTTLKSLIESFKNEDDAYARQKLVLDIIYHWAGVQDIDPGSRGGMLDDARKLATLEAFLGEKYSAYGASVPQGPNAAAKLNGVFESLASAVYGKIMLQTHFASLLDGVSGIYGREGFEWDVSSVVVNLKSQFDADYAKGEITIAELSNGLVSAGDFGQALLKQLRGFAKDGEGNFSTLLSVIGLGNFGGFGSDLLNGTSSDDYLSGMSGNDTISGGEGDDDIYGGLGDDYLSGGNGSDTYHFNVGDGKDIISNQDFGVAGARSDRILFGAGISPSDVLVKRNGYDLVLFVKGAQDGITIQGYFNDVVSGGYNYSLEKIQFEDGSFWTVEHVRTMSGQSTDGNDQLWGDAGDNSINGGQGDDLLYGLTGDDILEGGAGNDIIYGADGVDSVSGGDGQDNLYGGAGADLLAGVSGNDNLYGDAGDDVLDGGAGNDMVSGGEGSDTYRFSRGWGQDSINNYDTSTNKTDAIEFAADILPGDIVVTRSYDDLVLTLNGSADRVTVSSYFSNDGDNAYKLDEIRFADGTNWSLDQVKSMAIQPTDGNDSI
ncbi:calcium-binding protein, partial [Pseudomonas viridiflava]